MIVILITPQSLPSTDLPIHCPSIILPFNEMQTEQLETSVNEPRNTSHLSRQTEENR
jgi:hypothetical protein